MPAVVGGVTVVASVAVVVFVVVFVVVIGVNASVDSDGKVGLGGLVLAVVFVFETVTGR